MALLIGDNFSYNGKKPNFERDSFETLATLKAIPEANIDNGHIAYCIETNKHYIFNDSNSDDATTGKWRVLESEFSNKVDISDLDEYLTKTDAQSTYQPIGNYALKSDISDLASKDEIPTKVSELENDSNYLTSIPEEYVTDTELNEAISGVQFELPIASNSVLGGVKIGAGLSINSGTGVLSVNGGGTADSVDWSGVQSKPQINGHELVSGNNTLDSLGIQPSGNYALKSDIPNLDGYATQSWVNSQNYLTSIPTASSNTLGGIKVGAGLSITGDGILSATGGGVADSVAWENVVGRPTKLSQFTNDSGFITSDSLSNYALKSELPDISGLATKSELSGYALVDHTHVVADITDFPEIPDTSDFATKEQLAAKQDALISGTNIKTINGTSLLGSGNITIESSGGGSEITDVLDNNIYGRTQGSWVDLTDYLTWGEYD